FAGWTQWGLWGRSPGPPALRIRENSARCQRISLLSGSVRESLLKVAPQHERRARPTRLARIIAGPPADLAETGAVVEPERRLVGLLDLEKHRTDSETREAPQVQIEQAARDAATAPARGHPHR